MCVCVAVNSPACYIWIINYIDSNTSLFSVIVCVMRFVCVSVCV